MVCFSRRRWRAILDSTAFIVIRDFSVFLVGARTDQAIAVSRSTLGARGAFEEVYTHNPDPWKMAHRRYRYQQRKYEQIIALLPSRRFERALDLGCGLGLLTRMLAERAEHVVGLDIASAAIARAIQWCRACSNVELRQGDVLDLPRELDGTFDLVILADTIYYLQPLDDAVLKALAMRVADLLRPGGTCVVANHFFFSADAESRVSQRIDDAFRWSPRLTAEGSHRRAFFIASVLRKYPDADPSLAP